RRMPFAQMRLQQGIPCSPTPWGQMAHRHQTRNSWDGLSGHPAWVYILGGRGGDAEQGTSGAGVRGEAADGASGSARHPRFSCGDCDRRREHCFRRISAVMYKALRYDPINDFQMVSMVATAGLVLVAAPDFPANDLAGVLAAVRANPGKFNFGSAG